MGERLDRTQEVAGSSPASSIKDLQTESLFVFSDDYIERLEASQALAAQNIGRGDAEAIKARGIAEAEAIKARGLAEAEVVLARGQAEAEAMRKKAEAWRTYNEAAIAQMFIEKLPELARAIADTLATSKAA